MPGSLTKLPGWVVDNRTSVLREVERYRDMPVIRRLEILASLCRGAIHQLEGRSDRRRMLDWRDPLPRSTVNALARLRSDAHRGNR
jgi:hypothetical protein